MLVPMPAGAARRQLPARNGELPPPIFEAETGEAPRHLRDYLSVLHKYRWLAVACFGGTVGLTILVTLLTRIVRPTGTPKHATPSHRDFGGSGRDTPELPSQSKFRIPLS